MSNPFVLPAEQYRRDLDLVGGYVKQQAHFISIMTGDSYAECVNAVKDIAFKDPETRMKDPDAVTLRQETPGNRERVDATFLGYLRDVVETERILSPSMVMYERPDRNKSTSAAFIEGGIAERKKAKAEMFAADMAGDRVLEYIKDCEQNSKKIGINAVSGMHGFEGNILYVKSGHSSLTSMCRASTSYGNANNEKFIMGSRHYWSIDITIANIITLVTTADYDQLEWAIEKYGIVYPSVEQTMDCITWSTMLYSNSVREVRTIRELVERLTPIQRAAVVYIGDLYHLAKYNDQVVRDLMDAFIVNEYEGAVDVDKAFAENAKDKDLVAYANIMSGHLLKGGTREDLKERDPEGYAEMARIIMRIKTAINEYAGLIRALWVPRALPPTAANIRSIVRRTVLASDTDSTIFTTQHWVEWYTGSLKRTSKGDGIWCTVTYMATQMIIHVLAQFSANMGVDPSHLHKISMKNEYAFPVFALTSRAKHYFAFMSAKEGNVYLKYKSEIKGVALRSSVVPFDIIEDAKKTMLWIMTKVDNNEKISLREVYGKIYRHEMDIFNSVRKGESRYLKSGQIKEKYKNMDSSPFQQYVLWEEVFAPKYGSAGAPPYGVIKIPLEINNKTEMTNWVNSIKDRELATRLAGWMERTGKVSISMLLLPAAQLANSGMPEEIMDILNTRKLTFEILESFYLLLESLGVYQVDGKHQRLVQDVFSPEPTDPEVDVITQSIKELPQILDMTDIEDPLDVDYSEEEDYGTYVIE